VVAVVGRPNVGKSTLVNRILGSRQAVVEDTPGVTRDRVAYDATWRGRAFTLVDTGGWEPAAEGSPALAARVAAQARVAVDAADAVLFVVDAVIGVTDADAAVAAVLRRSRKPVVLAANKVDDAPGEPAATSLWSLGLGEPCPVSALHGRGSGDLLDLILDALPATPMEPFGDEGGPRRVALIGRPNVGKSSLLNQLAGQERVLVDAVAGTTRDPVDELIELGGSVWRFVDTAGIRRRVRETQGADVPTPFPRLSFDLIYARPGQTLDVWRAELRQALGLAADHLSLYQLTIEPGTKFETLHRRGDIVLPDGRTRMGQPGGAMLYATLGAALWGARVAVVAPIGEDYPRDMVAALEARGVDLSGLRPLGRRPLDGRLEAGGARGHAHVDQLVMVVAHSARGRLLEDPG
jgi:small GTP-binding protein